MLNHAGLTLSNSWPVLTYLHTHTQYVCFLGWPVRQSLGKCPSWGGFNSMGRDRNGDMGNEWQRLRPVMTFMTFPTWLAQWRSRHRPTFQTAKLYVRSTYSVHDIDLSYIYTCSLSLSIYIYIFICLFIYLYVYIYKFAHTRTHVYIYICMYFTCVRPLGTGTSAGTISRSSSGPRRMGRSGVLNAGEQLDVLAIWRPKTGSFITKHWDIMNITGIFMG